MAKDGIIRGLIIFIHEEHISSKLCQVEKVVKEV